ncbi:hypothetical protein PTI98_013210 [Pleurotus ostreatus]|nr:hypothetical protein PTI98_013210 [Pleurotus ostreatus]
MGTPQLPAKTDPKSGVASSLPRFQGRRKGNDKPESHSGGHHSEKPSYLPYRDPETSTDESDLEYRYEAVGRERRRLVVANADAHSISSSSESDVDGRRSRVPVPTDRNKPSTPKATPKATGYSRPTRASPSQGTRPVIGLGLDLSHNRPNTIPDKRSNSRSRLREIQVTQNTHSVGDVGHNEKGQLWRGDHTTDDVDDIHAVHERRREALLGIVSGLALGSDSNDTSLASRQELDDHLERGVAISGSGDVHRGEDDFRDMASKKGTPRVNYSRDDVTSSSRTIPSKSPKGDKRSLLARPPPVTHGSKSPSKSQDGSRSPVIKTVTSPPGTLKKRMSAFYVNSSDDNDEMEREHEGWQRLMNHKSPPQGERKHCSNEDYDGCATQPSSISSEEARHDTGEASLATQMMQSQSEGTMSQAGSDVSAVEQHITWQDEGYDGLSVGAEALFRKISGSETLKRANERREETERSENTYSSRSSRSTNKSSSALKSPPVAPRLNNFPATEMAYSASDASIYDDEEDAADTQGADSGHSSQQRGYAHPQPPSWQADVPAEIYEVLFRRHGECELRRQQLIWEICESEKTYVARLQMILDLFILPLRVKDSKAWISGVPLDLAKLLDWLDDIVKLHVQLLDAIQRARTAQYPVVERIAEAIRPFVPRLEVYQPYLVRLGDLTELVSQQVKDATDLGEFIKMQETSAECDGWTIETLLSEPVNRLAQYPELFQRLQDVTQKAHPDYLSAVILCHSTNLMIRIMTEVKIREDEYELVKGLSTRIRDLPADLELPKRDRRLIMEGALRQVQPATCREMASPSQMSTSPSFDLSKRSDILANAVSEWGSDRRNRSESTASSSTGVSFRSYSSTSSAFPITPVLGQFPSGAGLSMPNSKHQPKNKATALPTSKYKEPFQPPQAPSDLVHIFLFTDLALFVHPEDGPGTSWSLMNECGVVQIIDVAEAECHEANGKAIKVDFIPLRMDDRDGSPQSFCFCMPNEEFDATAWVSAFRKCQSFTLRSLSIPSCYGSLRLPQKFDGPPAAIENTIQTILASGLPMPKSPSVQLTSGERGNVVSREREERGWWSVRFRQVLREVQYEEDPYFVSQF